MDLSQPQDIRQARASPACVRWRWAPSLRHGRGRGCEEEAGGGGGGGEEGRTARSANARLQVLNAAAASSASRRAGLNGAPRRAALPRVRRPFCRSVSPVALSHGASGMRRPPMRGVPVAADVAEWWRACLRARPRARARLPPTPARPLACACTRACTGLTTSNARSNRRPVFCCAECRATPREHPRSAGSSSPLCNPPTLPVNNVFAQPILCATGTQRGCASG